MERKKNVLIASMMGTTLEYYDFALYSVFIHIFANTFFPSSDPIVSLLFSWGAFTSGFITRPIGAIFFGHIGDKYGRKQALTFAMLFSAIPMLIIGCMPSYETIGIMAPCLVIFVRLIQGISLGGEFNGAAIFVLEHLSKSNRSIFPGISSGMVSGSAGIGFIAAMLMGIFVEHFKHISWLWRLPFIFGSLIGFVGFYVRYKTNETPEFTSVSNPKKEKISLFQILKMHPRSCVITFMIGAFSGALAFTTCAFLPHYISKYLGFSLEDSMKYTLLCLSTSVIACPLWGYISDHFEKRTYFAIATLGLLSITSITFYLVQTKLDFNIILGEILFGFFYASICGPQHAFIQRLFPVGARYTGIAFFYCMGGTLFGGTAPMMMTYLITKTSDLNIPAMFISGYGVAFLLALTYLGSATNQKQQPNHLRKAA